jgi:hypothetical protein
LVARVDVRSRIHVACLQRMIQLTATTTMIMATTIASIILINLIIIISIKMMTRVVLILIDDVDQSLSKIRDIVLVNENDGVVGMDNNKTMFLDDNIL